jgi:hypothetical protein
MRAVRGTFGLRDVETKITIKPRGLVRSSSGDEIGKELLGRHTRGYLAKDFGVVWSESHAYADRQYLHSGDTVIMHLAEYSYSLQLDFSSYAHRSSEFVVVIVPIAGYQCRAATEAIEADAAKQIWVNDSQPWRAKDSLYRKRCHIRSICASGLTGPGSNSSGLLELERGTNRERPISRSELDEAADVVTGPRAVGRPTDESARATEETETLGG